jgi:hypothetical protein
MRTQDVQTNVAINASASRIEKDEARDSGNARKVVGADLTGRLSLQLLRSRQYQVRISDAIEMTLGYVLSSSPGQIPAMVYSGFYAQR